MTIVEHLLRHGIDLIDELKHAEGTLYQDGDEVVFAGFTQSVDDPYHSTVKVALKRDWLIIVGEYHRHSSFLLISQMRLVGLWDEDKFDYDTGEGKQ